MYNDPLQCSHSLHLQYAQQYNMGISVVRLVCHVPKLRANHSRSSTQLYDTRAHEWIDPSLNRYETSNSTNCMIIHPQPSRPEAAPPLTGKGKKESAGPFLETRVASARLSSAPVHENQVVKLRGPSNPVGRSVGRTREREKRTRE